MFALSADPLDAKALKEPLGDPSAGACATFEGWVRDHNEGRTVVRLEYEAYEELALKVGSQILAEAHERFGLTGAACVHRVGSLDIGALAVWVGASAAHRDEAFAACRYIIDEIKARVPIWKKEHYADGDSGWVNCEQCEAHAHAHGHSYHAKAPSITARDEALYYSRQTVMPELGIDGQQKLKKARVLVVGAGGLGCPALQFLAAAGVGTIGICDADRLDVSNLHRQVLYGYGDIGRPKAELAAERLRKLNPFISVTPYTERVTAENARIHFEQYDVVLDCTDNFDTKYLLNDTAVQMKRPLVQAGVYKFEGQIHVCDPTEESGCLRCLWPEQPEEGCVGSCVEVGVLGMVPGLLGTLQAAETVKLILGMPGVLRGTMLLVNLLNHRVHRMPFAKNPACPVCGNAPRPAPRVETRVETGEVDVDIAKLTPEAVKEFSVIDIREPFETRVRPLTEFPCREIPMSVFTPDTLSANGEKYLLCCAHGVRSRNLALALRRGGLSNVYSMRGGIAGL